MNIAVGIPTLNRKDLLDESLEDLSHYLSDISHLYIVDNGNQGINIPSKLKDKTTLYTPKKNLGVAGSWNKILRQAFLFNPTPIDYVLMLNDDVVLSKTRDQLIHSIKKHEYPYFITCGKWCTFLISNECFQSIGPFDTHFYPAYFEDNDYSYRLKINHHQNVIDKNLFPKTFRTSQTIKKDPKLNKNFDTLKSLYIRKWGGTPGNETYTQPYNRTKESTLNVITRTSQRPKFFHKAYNSIQKIPNVNHIVITDDPKNSDYVFKYTNIHKLILLNRDLYYSKHNHGASPYNEYLNHAITYLNPEDYFVILDDDDYFPGPHRIHNLYKQNKQNDLIIWKVRAAGGTVPYAKYFKNKRIVRANIAMPGFMMKKSLIEDFQFDSNSMGDYKIMSTIYPRAKNPLWVNEVLASTTEGQRQGKGERKDVSN